MNADEVEEAGFYEGRWLYVEPLEDKDDTRSIRRGIEKTNAVTRLAVIEKFEVLKEKTVFRAHLRISERRVTPPVIFERTHTERSWRHVFVGPDDQWNWSERIVYDLFPLL
jgi:hypothetical protein